MTFLVNFRELNKVTAYLELQLFGPVLSASPYHGFQRGIFSPRDTSP
jgi:hypothetical protein